MGCGYSKLRGSKKRGRLKVTHEQEDDDDDNDEDVDDSSDCESDKYQLSEQSQQQSGTPSESSDQSKNGILTTVREEDSVASRRRNVNRTRPISGPMRPPISASQLSFFRMLDEKIANGRDLDDEDDSRLVQNTVIRRRNSSISAGAGAAAAAAGAAVASPSDDGSKSNGDSDGDHLPTPTRRTLTNGQVTS